MKKKEYRALLAKSTLTGLKSLHSTYVPEIIRDAMLRVYGFPHHCIICAEPLLWTEESVISDVDAWFCSNHCPICNGEYS